MAKIISKEGIPILVDDNKFEELSQYKWRIDNGYAVAQMNKRTVAMHRYLMNPQKGMAVIHSNLRWLDNRLENLKIVTLAERSKHYHEWYNNRERDENGYLVPYNRNIEKDENNF